MRSTLKRISIKIAGWCFIVLGVAGLFLPILQGILFLLVGLYLLSLESPWAARLLSRVRRRFPKLSDKLQTAKDRANEVQKTILKRFQKKAENAE